MKDWRTRMDATKTAGGVMEILFEAKRYREFAARATYYADNDGYAENITFGCGYFAPNDRMRKTFQRYAVQWDRERLTKHAKAMQDSAKPRTDALAQDDQRNAPEAEND